MSVDLTGVFTALVTPFKNGAVDLESFKKLIRAQLDAGIHGFVVNGTTGESPTLSSAEVETLVKTAQAEVAGQVPIIVGTGSNSTAATVAATKRACDLGADAVLVVVPYYNKPTQKGLLAHFTAVADASNKPVLLYNVPGRTITSLEPESIAKLAEHPRIVGVKDATGKMDILAKTKALVKSDFILLSGDDGTFVEFVLNGGHGIIAVASHVIGREMVSYLERAEGGDKQAAADYQKSFAEFFKYLYIEANPIPVKAVLAWQGLIESAEMRLPLTTLDESFHKDFKACLQKLAR